MRHLVKIFNRPSISCHITFMCLALAVVESINVAALGQCELQTIWSPDGGGPNYTFGISAAGSASMDVIVIGEKGRDNLAGAAYIYRNIDNEWQLEEMFVADDGPQFGTQFGKRVDMSADGKTVIISELLDANNGLFDAGAVWVYVEDEGKWGVQQKLTASDAEDVWVFGEQIALSADGNVAAISATGAPTDPVYVFTREGEIWTEAVKLEPDGWAFGLPWIALSTDGSVIAIGADDSAKKGPDAGATYIYIRSKNQGSWQLHQKLLSSDNDDGDSFGRAVSLSENGDTILMGANGDDEATWGAGAAYIFQRDGDMWYEQTKIMAADAQINNHFGAHTKITPDGQRTIISASNGSSYVFDFVDGKWIESMRVTSPDPDFLGIGKAIAITDDGSTVLLGAPNSRVDGVLWYGAVGLFDLEAPLGDLNCDGVISTSDLLTLLSDWGPCDDCEFYNGCLGDLNLDCTIGTSDLLILLSNWG